MAGTVYSEHGALEVALHLFPLEEHGYLKRRKEV